MTDLAADLMIANIYQCVMDKLFNREQEANDER